MDTERDTGNLEPNQVMHEDDPVLVKHYPTKINRQNVKRFAVFGAILTFALFVYTGYSIITEHNARHQDINNQITKLACAIVQPFPNRVAPLVRELRKEYHCPPYSPSPVSMPTQTETQTVTISPPASSHKSSRVPHPGKLSHPVKPGTVSATKSSKPQGAGAVPTRSATPSRSPVPTRSAQPTRTSTPTPSPSSTPTLPVSGILGGAPAQLDTTLCNYLGICTTLLEGLLNH